MILKLLFVYLGLSKTVLSIMESGFLLWEKRAVNMERGRARMDSMLLDWGSSTTYLHVDKYSSL